MCSSDLTDIRMFNDGYQGTFTVFVPGQASSLDSLLCVIQGIQVCGRCIGEGLKTRKKAGFIHHVEHDLEPFVFLSQQQATASSLAAK